MSAVENVTDDEDLNAPASRAAEKAGLPSITVGPDRRARERHRAVARRMVVHFFAGSD